MTGRQPGDGGSWRDARPEIIIAAILVAAVGVAGYALAGAAAPGVVATGTAVIVLVAFRGMLPPEQAAPQDAPETAAGHRPASFTGFWRKRAGLADGMGSAAAYDAALRPTLQHLLAARLAERHGISLRDDPDHARRLFCRGDRDDGLWYWVDPARPAIQAGEQPGIPPRTLARLIDRLERL